MLFLLELYHTRLVMISKSTYLRSSSSESTLLLRSSAATSSTRNDGNPIRCTTMRSQVEGLAEVRDQIEHDSWIENSKRPRLRSSTYHIIPRRWNLTKIKALHCQVSGCTNMLTTQGVYSLPRPAVPSLLLTTNPFNYPYVMKLKSLFWCHNGKECCSSIVLVTSLDIELWFVLLQLNGKGGLPRHLVSDTPYLSTTKVLA